MEDNNIEWSEHYEKIFADWCDKSMCYRYLHSKCNRYYHKLQIRFTIPVILISTLTGVANFAQNQIPNDYKIIYTMTVGGFNILAGFITTIAQFLKINELNEGHRVSAISWNKFCKNIKIELAKSPEEREDLNLFLKKSKEQYDLLLETSPVIRYAEIVEFNRKFKSVDFNKPEICDSLVSVNKTIYKSEPDQNIKVIENIKEQKLITIKNIEIEKFVKSFNQQNGREPSIEEIYDNLEDNIPKKFLDIFISKLNKNKNSTLHKNDMNDMNNKNKKINNIDNV